MGAGALLLGKGLLDLGRSLTPLPHPRDDARLVVSGVYGLVRHPIYGGIIVTSFGWALVAASPVTLGLSLRAAGLLQPQVAPRGSLAAGSLRGLRGVRGADQALRALPLLDEETRWRGREEGADLATGQKVRVTCSTPIREGEGFLTTGAVQWNGFAMGCSARESAPARTVCAPHLGTSAPRTAGLPRERNGGVWCGRPPGERPTAREEARPTGYQPRVPGPPLKGPLTSGVIQPP